jgi:hypothetical protein
LLFVSVNGCVGDQYRQFSGHPSAIDVFIHYRRTLAECVSTDAASISLPRFLVTKPTQNSKHQKDQIIMGFLKRALTLPVSRGTYVEKELVKQLYPEMTWKLAKKEADKTREIVGHGASPEEILRVTKERLEASSPAPTPVEEPVQEERELETEKEEEVNAPSPEPVEEERELEIAEEEEEEEEEEELLPGITCGDIDLTVEELETVSPAPKPIKKPMEEKHELETEKEEEMDTPAPEPLEQECELEMEEEESGIRGLTWGHINRTNANMQNKFAALMTCW